MHGSDGTVPERFQESKMQNPIHWFEIPTTDLDRAVAFYQEVFAIELHRESSGPAAMAIFPYAEPQQSGALVKMDTLLPGMNGPLIYLDGGADLNHALNRARALGAEVLLDKLAIGEHGFIAVFRDCEGNRIGLHSLQ